MSNSQLYFAIGVPVFAVFMGTMMSLIVIIWQARSLERRIDRLESRFDKVERTLELIQSDLKQFYGDIRQLKDRTGL